MQRESIMAVYLILFPAILFSHFALSEPFSRDQYYYNPHLTPELHELQLKVARLEFVLRESIDNISAKNLYRKELQKQIEDMDNRILNLQSALVRIQGDSSHADERINALEEEVRNLWAASRKNNFDLHILVSEAQDTVDRLEAATSRVEKMSGIVNEQWIQIQHLEQALHITEMRTLKIQRQVQSTRCTLLKCINVFSGDHLQNVLGLLDSHLFRKGSFLNSFLSQTLEQLKRVLSAVRKYHHELQGLIKQEMERDEFTAALANSEFIFFVASALIILPILCGWVLLSQSLAKRGPEV